MKKKRKVLIGLGLTGHLRGSIQQAPSTLKQHLTSMVAHTQLEGSPWVSLLWTGPGQVLDLARLVGRWRQIAYFFVTTSGPPFL